MKRSVPSKQSLSPLILLSKSNQTNPFPFSMPNAQYYYLARNGIWHGLDALGLKPGDEILMPAYHHGVEVEVLKAKGMKLNYYRIDETMQMDFSHLESLVSDKTRLLYVIHYLGFPQPIQTIQSFVKKHNLLFFEDCALSLFSQAPEGALGTFGDMSIFCLYKSLPVPHGGMLIANKPVLEVQAPTRFPNTGSTILYLANRMLNYVELKSRLVYGASGILHSLGRGLKRGLGVKVIPIDTDKFSQDVVNLGISKSAKYIIDRVHVTEVFKRRRENFNYLNQILNPDIKKVFNSLPEGCCPLSFPILVKDKNTAYENLLNEGVETITFWSVDNPDLPRGTFPDVDFLRKHVLEVPIHQFLDSRHLDYMAGKLEKHARW